MSFAKWEAPERGDYGNFKPTDHLNTPIIVRVNEHKTGIVTEFNPDGGNGVNVDVCDYGNNDTQLDVLWMNGALVDGLKQYVGQTLVIRLEYAKSKNNRQYVTVAQASDAEIAAAEAYVKKNGDPFAPTLATVTRGDDVPF